MAMIFLKKEDIQQYAEYESKAFQTALAIGSTQGIFEVGSNWGTALVQAGHKEEGKQILELALNAGKQASFPGVEQFEQFLQRINGY